MSVMRCKPLLLAVVTVLSLLSIRCGESPAPVSSEAVPQQTVIIQASPTPEIPAPAPVVLMDDARRAHEDGARIALANIKTLMAAQDYDNAQRLAANSAKDYADTAAATEFAALYEQAQMAATAVARDRALATAAPADERAARHARFAAARDAGIAAMDRRDYAGAIDQFQNALREEDDPETRAMLRHASSFVGKPRIAVAEFVVVGDVGIPDAGKAVPELMLGRFDPQRFQLVERAWLDAALAQQGLSVAQVSQMPSLLRVRRVDAVRYLVVGSISRLGTLTVSARLVDVSTGEVVQTADAVAYDPVGLQNSLAELTAILQMTNEEKANYLAFRQRQMEALAATDPAAQAAAEAQRQAALEAQRQQIAREQAVAFQRAQHERDAAVALWDIKALFAQGDFANALRYIRWARPRFADTSAAQELAALDGVAQARYQEQIVQQANAAEWARTQAARAARHQRFAQFRDQGMTALAANDLLAAMTLLQNALNEEDNPGVRDVLNMVARRLQRPGIVVLDFDVRGDIGIPPRDAPRWLASLLLRQFADDNSPYRVVERDEFLADLQRAGLTLADVRRDPLQPRMRQLRDQVRFIIVGTASHGSIDLSTAMIDLAAGRTVQTADFIAENVRAVPDAIAGTALVLQMNDDQKHAYLNKMEYANWMARGDAAAHAQQWDAALDAYTRACRINNTPDALDHMTAAARQIEDVQRARRAYDSAMAAAGNAARIGKWDQALDLYSQAWGINPTAEAKAGQDNARAKVLAAARDRHVLYTAAIANGDAFAQSNDWDKALDAYQQALQIEPTSDAMAAVNGAKKALADRQQARQRAYAAAMGEAKSAIQAGNWTQALDAYTRAAAMDNTREATSGIATARNKIAESESDTKLYNAAMQEARTSVQANDWQKALAAHTRAAGIMNTAEVQAAITEDKKRLADIQQRDQQKLYDAAMADAATHVTVGNWQEALDAYRAAYQIQKTKEASAGITQATKMLSDAAYHKKQYDKAMADAAAADRARDWLKALTAYQQAAAIDATAEAKAGADRARQQLAAAAAADKRKQFTQWMNDGDAAAKAGDWRRALGSYTKAAAVDDTPEVRAAIAGAQKKITDADTAAAAAAEQKRQYNQLLTAGEAAAKSGDWQKALDAYTKVAALDNTPQAQAGIKNATKKLADAAATAAAAADKKKQYDALLADGAAAARTGDWQKAMDAFTKAAAINNTPEVKTALAAARKQMADTAAASAVADAKKKEYTRQMIAGDAAARTNSWQKALDAYTRAAALDNTPEVEAGIANARKKLAGAN
jgi:tetratricopeptide (TPR) repeat protein